MLQNKMLHVKAFLKQFIFFNVFQEACHNLSLFLYVFSVIVKSCICIPVMHITHT